MKLKIYEDYQTMCVAAADEIAGCLRAKPDAVLCLPSGDTPRGIYQALLAREDCRHLFKACTVVALDEWVGVDQSTPGTGKHMLEHDFLLPAGIRPEQFLFFDSLSNTLEEDCRRMDRLVDEKGGFDVMLLGVGMNGHVGLNEPGAAPDSDSHIQKLDETTRTVGLKYFSGGVREVVPYGVTQGMKRMISSKKLMVAANAKKKAPIIAKVVDGPQTSAVPASLLKVNPDMELYLDRDAASEIRTATF